MSGSSHLRVPALLALCLLVFLPTLGFTFVNWDDYEWIVDHPHVRDPLSTGLTGLLLTPERGYPQPLTLLTHAFDSWLGSGSAWPFHLSNLLIHSVNVTLAYRILSDVQFPKASTAEFDTRPRMEAPWVAAAFFAVHPIVAEPVSWATGRKDLLMTLFVLAAVRCVQRGITPHRLLACAACYVLALASKPTAAVLPLLLAASAACGILPWRTASARQQRFAVGWLVTASAVGVAVTYVAWLEHRAIEGLVVERSVNASMLYATQHWALAWRNLLLPAWLSPIYFEGFPQPWTSVWGLWGLAASGAWLATCIVAFKRGHMVLLWGLVWTALSFAPASGLVPMVRGPADSYLYLALLGASAIAGWTVASLARRLSRRSGALLRVALGSLVLSLALGSAWQSSHWSRSTALWQRVRTLYPTQPFTHQAYADALLLEGFGAAALPHIERALELSGRPEDSQEGIELLARACLAAERYDCARRWSAKIVSEPPLP